MRLERTRIPDWLRLTLAPVRYVDDGMHRRGLQECSINQVERRELCLGLEIIVQHH
jgi:hypothetical protein